MPDGAPPKEVTDLLHSNAYFDNQPDSFFSGFAALLKRREMKDGDLCISEGQHVDRMILLEDGTLERTRSNPATTSSEPMVIDVVAEKGRALCVLHLLTRAGDPSYATVKAKGSAVVWEMPREEFQKFMTSAPEYALALMANMAAQLRSGSKIMRAIRQQQSGDENFQGQRILSYDSSAWVRENFTKGIEEYNKTAPAHLQLSIDYTGDTLSSTSAGVAVGHDIVCLFVNDTADRAALMALSNAGVKMIAMRCAGYDRVDAKAAETLGFTVARVPAYSPYAVAEHGVALLMALNRKLYKAIPRVHDFNFTLDGLSGFDMHGKTVGVVGTGKIGQCLCNILLGFGVNLICFDVYPNDGLKAKGAKYVEMDEIWGTSTVIFLMTPLLPSTHHIFNSEVLPKLKRGVYIINTSRGGLVETKALISGLKSGAVGGAALDVYENEAGYFFRDHSDTVVADEQLTQLLSFHNVILTAHQAFFTQDAITNIVNTTLANIRDYMEGKTGREHPNSIYSK
eukprot:TRINITY_DN1841_c0_g2_i2.p1 TRINITY_DN1841_c0_g2~~TRINITY_DN1841_c0_g2_i2.p1  ORF type:complete len:511 (-),score=142.39 TRINITY_DN1841_c0_g2_i2:352-1884(-)